MIISHTMVCNAFSYHTKTMHITMMKRNVTYVCLFMLDIGSTFNTVSHFNALRSYGTEGSFKNAKTIVS
jgi:uncharacterized membrane protein